MTQPGAGETGADGRRFARLEALFQEGRRVPAAERAAWIERACAGEESLREPLARLLARHDAEPGGLDAPALGPLLAAPERIGPYRLLERIGEGGMGVVYLAEQDRPRRTVALKLVAPALATPTMLRRFEREAELLGRLHHPGIAQIHAAGVHGEGARAVPYIAMELVHGVPVDAFARDHGLDLRARLALLADVCDAVQHAHEQGVVHRDLKPGNVLVEGPPGAPRPRVLDFGVARALDADLTAVTRHTSPGELVGTLRSMSPEQASGDLAAVDERTDVYALGVLLYELVAGRPPHRLDGLAMHAAIRVVREDDPPPLSALSPAWRGDLDTIARTALAKEPARRYASAAALGADLRRFLAEQPILARPASTAYQVRKFARRHRAAVTLGAAVLVALIAGLVATAWQWRKTERARLAEADQRRVAQRRFDEVRELADTFLFEIDERLQRVAGALPARRLLVSTALEYLRRLAADAAGDPLLRARIATAYARVGDIQGGVDLPSLGDPQGALASYRAALALVEELLAEGRDPALMRSSRYRTLAKIGDVLAAQGRLDEALEHFHRAREVAAERAARDPDPGAALRDETTALERIGSLLLRSGRTDEARAVFAQTLARGRAAAQAPGAGDDAVRDLAVGLFQTGTALQAAGELDAALEHFEQYLAIVRPRAAGDPTDVVARRDLAIGLSRIGEVQVLAGRAEAARAAWDEQLAIHEDLLARDASDALNVHDLAGCTIKLGELHLAAGAHDAAAAAFERTLALAADLAARAPDNADFARRHGVALYKLGELARARAGAAASVAGQRAHWDEARACLERCRAVFVGLRDRGLLAPGDAGVVDEVAAERDAAAARLAGLGEP